MNELRCEMHPFRLPLRAPLVTGSVSVRFRAGFLVACSRGGHTGWGEACPLPGWSKSTVVQTSEALAAALEKVNNDGEAAVSDAVNSLEGFAHARAALVGALNDLAARESSTTLAEHLLKAHSRPATGCIDAPTGPPASVAVNALITSASPQEVQRQSAQAVSSGFGAVKLKVGAATPEEDIERVLAARRGMGQAAELRLDANGAWNHQTAVTVLRATEPAHIAFCEEPVSGIEAIAAVGHDTGATVAVDESMRTPADAAATLDAGVRVLMVKPQALGGPDRAMSVIKRATEAGALTLVTSFIDSAIGVSHALHVAAASDALAASSRPKDSPAGPVRAHGLATAELLARDVAQSPPIQNGRMLIQPAAGIGVEPHPDQLMDPAH